MLTVRAYACEAGARPLAHDVSYLHTHADAKVALKLCSHGIRSPPDNVTPRVRICEGGMAYHDLLPIFVLLGILMLIHVSSSVRVKACC